jgi:hypothetical protein
MRDPRYYRNYSTGTLLFGSDSWARVACDQGIVAFYCWLCKRHGHPIKQNWKFGGAHISFIRGEAVPNKYIWGIDPGAIEFWYSSTIRMDNNRHAWLDVWSDRLTELRALLGLPPKLRASYHLTLGRLD